MAYTGNGSTLAYGGTVSNVTQMEYSERCAKIDTSVLADSFKSYEAGQIERSVTATVLGESALVVGATPAVITVTFQGCTPVIATRTFTLTKNDLDAPIDGAITSSLAFVQTT